MVVSKLDPTMLQSKTCKHLNKIIKDLARIYNKNHKTHLWEKSDEEKDILNEAKIIARAFRNANAKVFGGAVAKRRREQEARERGYDRYGRTIGRR